MSSSEANLIPANNSVAIEDVYNNNDKIPATNDKIFIPYKRDCPDSTVVIIGDSTLNGIMQERLSRKRRAVRVHNFCCTAVDDMKHHIRLFRKEFKLRHNSR